MQIVWRLSDKSTTMSAAASCTGQTKSPSVVSHWSPTAIAEQASHLTRSSESGVESAECCTCPT